MQDKRSSKAKAKAGRRGNGEGSVMPRVRDGKTIGWRVVVSGPDGRIERQVRSEKEAHKVKVQLLATIGQGLPIGDARTTLGSYLDRWLADVAAKRVRPRTLTKYREDVRRVQARLGTKPLNAVTPAVVQHYLNAMLDTGLSPASVRHNRAVLRTALKTAVRWGLISRNPVDLTDPPKVKKYTVKALSAAEARAILDAFQGHALEGLIVTALSTGMRQGELLGLQWTDVDVDKAQINVHQQVQRIGGKVVLTAPKSDTGVRVVPLAAGAVEALRRQRARQLEQRLRAGGRWTDQGFVFTSEVGTPLCPSNTSRRFKAQLTKAGLGHMRFHDLRHGTAALLLAQGVSLKEISELLGHSQIGITADTYLSVIPQLKAAAAERLNSALWGTG